MRSRSLVMQLPVLDFRGEVALSADSFGLSQTSCPEPLHTVLGLEGKADDYKMKVILISEGHFLVSLQQSNAIPVYAWVDIAASKNTAKIHALREHQVLLSDIVRLIEPNRLSWTGKLGVYGSRWWEFLFGEPREAGVEGGVFPAIWGTIVMTLIMSMVVMPFGVLAALYMREYAKGGWLLSTIRISINNLAGVPSIVYGVFGLSFFCYTIGGYIDGGPVKAGFTPWPETTWFSALALLAIIGLVAFTLSFLTGRSKPDGSIGRRLLSTGSGLLWLATLAGIVLLLAKTPMFDGFYQAQLPNPTFGKGCLLWAACTLALLTLPVVIVATEEALAAVPNSLREGSYACGAGKWQTIERIVLPYARPGIITGFILAMARGAGEVAPMMLVGAIPLTSDLPLDMEFPFLHGSRSFMHLGFQIYALGFQSQNSEAAKPMVFTATLLLLTIVTLLNLTAIWLRARLRKRFQSSQF
ncbi:MAG: phosphate ABC transporter permease PstA [Planctomycetes bacterium]|nr:phosphate ABC transporter permease PstA [Planctomycetota bacterium]